MCDCMQQKVKITVLHTKSIDLDSFHHKNKFNFQVLRWVWHTMIKCITSIQLLIMQGVQTLPQVALKRPISVTLSHFHLYQYVLLTARVEKQV